MTDHEHNEIARGLRETGTVPAPDRLRAEVMEQVRAEPRLRPTRRSFVRPLLPYAAAAATLAVAVLALSHVDLGSSGMSSNGGGASGGGAASASDGAAVAPAAGGNSSKAPEKAMARDQLQFHISATAAQGVTASPFATVRKRTIILVVPPSQYADYKARLHKFEQQSGNATVRVILRKAE